MSCIYYVVVGAETDEYRMRDWAPLEDVSVTGLIRDSVAEYTLTQTFLNPRKDVAIEAVYAFPLHEGVAVSGFEAEVDGRKIVGRVQERAAARKEYDEAVEAGKVASLLEQERPDVFQASIGNIPPGQKIRIRLTLVSEIKQDADENQVRFVMPTAIAPRYGASPVSESNVDSSASKLSVNISCAMSKPITSIQSPSHTIQVHLGSGSDDDRFEPNRARVSLTTDALLDKDLVVIVQSQGLDAPRASVERHPRDGTHAVSLTFAPRFALNALRASELIFLVDRSGSMGGTKIQQAGEALELFLRSIPLEKHCFNVIGFGSTHKALFPKSASYDADSLKKSISYAQQLRADMGGTEMNSAFQEALQCRRRDVPTQIFLLTDGEIWDVDRLVEVVREGVEEGEKSSSFVRVFSLGVGASVSHHLIESVARAGGGYAQLVVEGERMEKKVVNMLKAALMPPVTDVGVQWTDATEEDFEMVESEVVPEPKVAPAPEVAPAPKPLINLFDTSPEVATPAPPPPPAPLPIVVIPIQQAPFKAPALYRGARFTMYAILSPTTPVPEELILRGLSPDGPVELKVKVGSLEEGGTMLHALTARALVRDLEEGTSCIHALGREGSEKRLNGVQVTTEDGNKYKDLPLSNNLVSELTKQRIVELALKYNLSSKHTSWVAIDSESQERFFHDEVKGVERVSQFVQSSGRRIGRSRYMCSGASMYAPQMSSAAAGCAQPVASASLRVGCAWPVAFASSPPAAFPSVQADMTFAPRAGLTYAPSAAAFGAAFGSGGISVPTTKAYSSACGASPGRQLKRRNQMQQQSGGLGAAFMSFFKKKDAGGQDSSIEPVMEVRKEEAVLSSPDPHSRLRSILQHQQFDGLFPLNSAIAALFATTVKELQGKLAELQMAKGVKLSETVWATCLAVELMRKHLPELQEEWELVVEKAEKQVAVLVTSPEDLAELQQAASDMVQATLKAN